MKSQQSWRKVQKVTRLAALKVSRAADLVIHLAPERDNYKAMAPTTITCTQCGAEIPYVSGCVICPVCGAKHCGE